MLESSCGCADVQVYYNKYVATGTMRAWQHVTATAGIMGEGAAINTMISQAWQAGNKRHMKYIVFIVSTSIHALEASVTQAPRCSAGSAR